MTIFFFFLSVSQALVLHLTGSANLLATVKDWISTYELLKPNSYLFYDVKSSSDAISNITAGAPYDFASIDSNSPTSAVWEAHPEFMLIPIAGATLVPQYNLDNLTKPLNFSRDILAQIFYGNITRWNDPQILEYNNLTADEITSENITVIYRADAGGANRMFTYGLSSFSTYWNQTYGVTSSFPASIVAKDPTRYIPTRNNLLINAQVLAIKNSIGYVHYAYISRDTQSQTYARLENIAGNRITAEPEHVAELIAGTRFDSHGVTNFSADVPSWNAWPFGGVQSILINTRPTNCTQAREVTLFLRWVLTNSLPRSRLSVNGFAPLAPETVEKESLMRLAQITCDGKPVMTYIIDDSRSGPLFVIAIIVAICFFILVIVLSTLHVHYFRSTPVNLVYSVIFVVGAFLCLSSPFLWLVIPSNTSICQARLWLTSIGLSTLLGTMFSRTSQLRDIYLLQKKNVDLIKAGVSVRSTLLKLIITKSIVLGVNLLILVVWTAADPYRASLRIDDDLDLKGSWSCVSSHLDVWLGLQLFFLCSLIVFGVIVIYQTWSFQRRVLLAEMRWVLISLYNIVLNLVALLPLVTLNHLTDSSLALIFIISIDFSGGGMVCAFLLPRVLSKLDSSSFDDHDKDKTVGVDALGSLSRKQTHGDGIKAPRMKSHDHSHTDEHSFNLAIDSQKPSDPSSNKGIELPSLQHLDNTTPDLECKDLEDSMVRAPKSTSEPDSPERHFISVPDGHSHYSDDDHDTTPLPSPSLDSDRGDPLPGTALDNSSTPLTGSGGGGGGSGSSGGGSGGSRSHGRLSSADPRLRVIDEREEGTRDEDTLMWQQNPIAKK